MSAHNKSKPELTQDPLEWIDTIREHPYFQWVIEHRQTISYIFLALVLSAILIFKFSSGRAVAAQAHYLQAENDFQVLQQDSKNAANKADALKNLETLTNEYPDIQSRYDGIIAQALISQGENKNALPYANRTLTRTAQDKLNFYSDFSRTTLLITQNQYQEALERSLNLKAQLIENASQTPENSPNREFGSLLYAYNLFRIAMLYQQLGNSDAEIKTWHEWEKFSEKTEQNINPQSFALLNALMTEGNFSLDQYIRAREALFSKVKS